MRGLHRIGRALSGAGRRVRDGLVALATGLAAAAARLAYRRRELGLIALLGSSLLGGFGIETWRGRAPGVLERLEAEAPRVPASPRSAVPRAPRARRARPPTSGDGGTEPVHAPAPSSALAPGTPAQPLDLNRASAADLTRLPGIGPRLAVRILARRDALGGQFSSIDDLAGVPGLGRRKAGALGTLVTVGPRDGEPNAAAPSPAADEGPR